jgi:cardiolipin synthase
VRDLVKTYYLCTILNYKPIKLIKTMKKFFVAMAFALPLVFTSCDKTEEPISLPSSVDVNIYESHAMEVSGTWTSSNEFVATVDKKGVITAHHVGDAVITVVDGGRTASCKVNVKPVDTSYTFPAMIWGADVATVKSFNNHLTLLEELEEAQKYIFMEYFIIDEGEMWNQILEVLERKAKEGVEVRVMYDDVGSFVLLPTNYPKILEKKGIKCVTFNQFKPFFIVSHNNRDHRKITVIDGKVGFTGGINLADEYINKKERHGYWKDASVMIQGEAVWSLTVIFLQLWNFSLKSTEDFAQFYPWKESKCDVQSDCFIQPYCDSPTDLENVGEHVYLNIITQAKKYLYIQTPYFIIDEQMLSAICLAAKSGVDVRLVTPFKWDKFLVHTLTRSYYNDLINAGVKVYEYTPGFIHSKVVISDDKVATVGSANFDYRSLYHHFECGTCIYDSKSIEPIYKDFMDIVEKSKLIEKTDLKYNVIKSLFQQILRVFAPLM